MLNSSLRMSPIALRGLGADDDMQKVNLEFFYGLGATLNPLVQWDTTGVTRLEAYQFLTRVRAAVASLFQWVRLRTCEKDGNALVAAIDNWIGSWALEKIGDPMTMVDTVALQTIVRLAGVFETVLYAELQPLPSVFIEKRGGYDTDVLMTTMEEVLPEFVRKRLKDFAKQDIQEAGKCMAFDNSTAVGYHILRATETVIQQYYQEVCKSGPAATTPRQPNWQRYIDALKTSTDTDVQKVLAMIELLKDEDRNLVMHPEKMLTVDDSVTLFEMCKAVIIVMAERLPDP